MAAQPYHPLQDVLHRLLAGALAGEDAHVDPRRALKGLDPALAARRPPGAPCSPLQLLAHLCRWQELALRALRGERVDWPPHQEAAGPEPPPDPGAWERWADRFLDGLEQARMLAAGIGPEDEGRLRLVLIMALHQSYHLGQLVLLRRMLGAWPREGGA